MRLTCPECPTPCEVARIAVGPGGRDVKCHECGHVCMARAAGERIEIRLIDGDGRTADGSP